MDSHPCQSFARRAYLADLLLPRPDDSEFEPDSSDEFVHDVAFDGFARPRASLSGDPLATEAFAITLHAYLRMIEGRAEAKFFRPHGRS